MKKVVLNLIIAAFVVQAFAQQPNRAETIERQLKEHPRQDTFRANRIIELYRFNSIPNTQLDSLGNETLLISKRLGYKEGEVEGMRMIAMVNARKGNTSAAKLLLDRTLGLAQMIADKTYLSDIYSSMAGLNGLIGDTKQALYYALKAEKVAELTQDKSLIATRQVALSSLYTDWAGDYASAMEWATKAEKNADEANDLEAQALCWSAMAAVYTYIGDQNNSLVYYKKALNANKKLGNKGLEFNLFNRIGERYRLMGRYKEAISAYREGLSKATLPSNVELVESNLADVYLRLGDLPMAYKYAFKSLHEAQNINDNEGIEWIDGILARAYLKRNMPDSAIFYAQTGYTSAVKGSILEFKRDNAKALTDAYAQKKDFTNAYKYQRLYVAYRDSMANSEVTNKANLLQYNYDLAKKQAQITSLNQQRKMQYYFLAGSVAILLIVGTMGIILWKNNRQKQKANLLLSKQKHEIEEQRDQTNKALAELQQTQTQLVQREKMASLGELTAGIAHEIQNPLNFVNNFSEVNREMLEELKAESEKPKAERDEQLETELINDLIENEQKISHHGKRADAIVKGMLQHSRAGGSTREPTDINKLADEYLRLAYHGLRAKDKSFNAVPIAIGMVTNFDEKLPNVNIIPQDIGRVLVNLFTNAFYAVNQKQQTAGKDYKPEVSVTTTSENGNILITVKDNGNGIPENIKDKIMQPFFTTKPAGEGTGLGLSLSYDIVVKGHGGTIAINSNEGESSEFIINLPVS